MHELSSPHPMEATYFDAALTDRLTGKRLNMAQMGAYAQLDNSRLGIPLYVHVSISGEGVAGVMRRQRASSAWLRRRQRE